MTRRARKRLVVGNWKMNLTEGWSVRLLDELLPRLEVSQHAVEVAVAPSHPCLRAVANRLAGSPVGLAAQDLHWEDKGAFTGEVSPRMLSEMGVRYAIVGHSERRTLFGETDERVRRKVEAARRHEIVPIVCVGEQESERDEGRTLEVVSRQLRLGLASAAIRQGTEVVIAYEPVWAIGTGRNATADQVHEVHRMIREQLASMFGPGPASHVRILYGGSATPDNIGSLADLEELDGGLVGGASLDAERFEAVVRAIA